MTEIVRASLGLPTLQAGPQFQNSKPNIIFIKNPKYVWVIENAPASAFSVACWSGAEIPSPGLRD